MAQFIGFLIAILSRPHRGAPDRKRALAIVSIVALLTGSLAPTWALAAEADSEGEGSAPPGLEDPSFEPGGEETALEGLPDSEAEGSEGDGEEPPVEPEPIEQPEFTEPAPAPVATAELSPPAPAPEVPLPPPDESTPPPSYEPAQSAPSYEAAPQPPPEPMENDAIVAPPGAAEDPPSAPHPAAPQPPAASPEAVTEAPPPEASSQESEPLVPAPVATPPDTNSSSLGRPVPGRFSYSVRPGDCLWAIAEALLPSGASNAEIAAEVERLWRLNEDRIGTGDPNLVLVGTVLRLG